MNRTRALCCGFTRFRTCNRREVLRHRGEARSNDHEGEAQEIEATPSRRVASTRVVRVQADAPDRIDWTRFHENPWCRAQKEVAKRRVLRKLRLIPCSHNFEPALLPDLLAES